jgi:hypothetical protein
MCFKAHEAWGGSGETIGRPFPAFMLNKIPKVTTPCQPYGETKDRMINFLSSFSVGSGIQLALNISRRRGWNGALSKSDGL